MQRQTQEKKALKTQLRLAELEVKKETLQRTILSLKGTSSIASDIKYDETKHLFDNSNIKLDNTYQPKEDFDLAKESLS